MADVKKIATRVSYGEALVELANEHDDFVVLDADLAAATQTGKFKAACPDRFFDVGIAESNLMGVAAGIATRSVPRTPASRWARMVPRTSAARISPSCASSPA